MKDRFVYSDDQTARPRPSRSFWFVVDFALLHTPVREVQVPTNWSNTSITISANLGKFASVNTAYLYVIDANGQPSPGRAVIIGADTAAHGPIVPPQPPRPDPTGPQVPDRQRFPRRPGRAPTF